MQITLQRWVRILGLMWLAIMLIAGIAQLVILRAQQTSVKPMIFEVPERLLPGNPPPTPCDVRDYAYYLYNSDTQYCSVNILTESGKYSLYIAYSKAQQQIIRTSYLGQGELLGKLVLAWGKPSHTVQHRWYSEVYWLDQHRYLWVFDTRLSPYSHRLYIIYTHDMKPDPADVWAGFKN